MKLVNESTGWKRTAGDIILKVEGRDIYICTITTWQVEAAKQRYKLLEESVVAVVRPKPKLVPQKWWFAMIRYLVNFDRISKKV